MGWEFNPQYYYCGRLTKYIKPDRYNFGNPFRIHVHGSRAVVIIKFEKAFEKNDRYTQKRILRELTGKILVCHCKPKNCHADTLADFCNANQASISYKLNELRKDD